jgi:hypothetical protein
MLSLSPTRAWHANAETNQRSRGIGSEDQAAFGWATIVESYTQL